MHGSMVCCPCGYEWVTEMHDEMSDASETRWRLDWAQAPAGWNWAAQDGDGCWYFYRTRPQPGFAGRVWRANSRSQQRAGQGEPNLDWHLTLCERGA